MIPRQEDIASYLDHTLLRPTATVRELDEVCSQAVRFGFYGVCVNPHFVSRTRANLNGSNSVPISVIGFPLGATFTEVKVLETRTAIASGACEVDMVMNIGAFKSGDELFVAEDIASLVNAASGSPVKVILETSILSDNEIERACLLSRESGAAFVKTSTGFGPAGASIEAVKIMHRTVGSDIGVKASGGILNYKDALAMIEAGATRLGTSASVAIISGQMGEECQK